MNIEKTYVKKITAIIIITNLLFFTHNILDDFNEKNG